MSELVNKEITVHDQFERPASALLTVCQCGSEHFFIYSVLLDSKRHTHLQCAQCGESYCNGLCTEKVKK